MAAGSTAYAFSADELNRIAGNTREDLTEVSGEYEVVDDRAADWLPPIGDPTDWLPPIEPESDRCPDTEPAPPPAASLDRDPDAERSPRLTLRGLA